MKQSAPRPRRRAVWVLLLLVLAALFLVHQSNTQLDVEEISVSGADIPDAFRGFRMVLLSDGHGAQFGKDNKILLAAVRGANPDLIVYTVDIIDNETQMETLPPLLMGLSELVKDSGAELVGAGICIEKGFQPGGKMLRDMGLRVESLAIIDSMSLEDGIKFR